MGLLPTSWPQTPRGARGERQTLSAGGHGPCWLPGAFLAERGRINERPAAVPGAQPVQPSGSAWSAHPGPNAYNAWSPAQAGTRAARPPPRTLLLLSVCSLLSVLLAPLMSPPCQIGGLCNVSSASPGTAKRVIRGLVLNTLCHMAPILLSSSMTVTA